MLDIRRGLNRTEMVAHRGNHVLDAAQRKTTRFSTGAWASHALTEVYQPQACASRTRLLEQGTFFIPASQHSLLEQELRAPKSFRVMGDQKRTNPWRQRRSGGQEKNPRNPPLTLRYDVPTSPERRITQVTDFARFAVTSAPIVAVAREQRFDRMLAGDSSSFVHADCQSDHDAKR